MHMIGSNGKKTTQLAQEREFQKASAGYMKS